ncbi:ribonuclease Y [candidate division GN15 bacterium]|uniref:Ribonuclease Y n=1 Tax=candidate division GN15 bacterium TaxID=2072418 RepID=A0A855X6A2_9BACT|nr:MAG: ribonuclease Y [candidate division GN15 bacterium]
MNNLLITVIAAVVTGAVAFVVAWLMAQRIGSKSVGAAKEQAKKIIADADKEAQIKKKESALEAREEWLKVKGNFEKEMEERRREIEKHEKRTEERDAALQKRVDFLDSKERELSGRDRNLQGREKGISLRETELDGIIVAQNDKLQKIAQMSPEEAKKQLMDNMVGEARMEAAAYIKEIREKAEQDAEKEAKEIILSAIYRCAADHTVESTVSVVNLPNDEMKGRIIGREGRNIRAFETSTGVDVIVDDTPEAVILSGYDPVRREIARMALGKLVTDGRIHPTRIEEVVEKSKKEMDVIIREVGEQACFELGVHGLHVDIIKQLGKLNYRTSYGQNVLAHSKEVAMLCGLMAAELELDAVLAKRCGLLHDIGKAIDRETEGTHTQIGSDFMSRYKESEIVINAIASHHNDIPMLSPYPVLVQAADAVSGARPGARREPLEAYIKRLTQLEDLADSFKGVSKAYAIQAGREIRVIVENSQVDDLASAILAGDIATKIESEMQYPGQIKVTVIRETRITEFAK